MSSIGIIGGTGKQGSGLARYFAEAGYSVRIGSRDKNRGEAFAAQFKETLSKDVSLTGGSNKFAAEADIIVLAIPFSNAEKLISPIKSVFEGKIVVDLMVDLKFGKVVKITNEGLLSSFDKITAFLEKSTVVGAMKTISADLLAKGDPIDQVDFIIGADKDARDVVSRLSRTVGLTPVHLPQSYHALTVERMVAMAIQLNKNYKGSHVGYFLKNIHFG